MVGRAKSVLAKARVKVCLVIVIVVAIATFTLRPASVTEGLPVTFPEHQHQDLDEQTHDKEFNTSPTPGEDEEMSSNDEEHTISTGHEETPTKLTVVASEQAHGKDIQTSELKGNDQQFCSEPSEVPLSRLSSLGFKPLTYNDIKGVENFVIFIGYPRSGHSIIGSVLDAHPNIVIAHEHSLIEKCAKSHGNIFQDKLQLFNDLYKNSFAASKCGWRSNTTTYKGYNFHMEGLWQGSFNQLKIIGDKSGGMTGLTVNSGKGLACLKKMTDTLNIPVSAVHVVRNPYDMIATEMQFRILKKTNDYGNRSAILTQTNSSKQMHYAKSILGRASAVVRIIEMRRMNVVEIHSEDYIRDPRMSLSKLCSDLGIACPENYIEQCYKKAYRKVSRSRDHIEWDPAVLQYISEEMRKFPFFRGYTFQDVYYNESLEQIASI